MLLTARKTRLRTSPGNGVFDQMRGDLEIAEVELYLPEDKLTNFREVVASSMEIEYEQKQREGNR